MRLGEGAQVTDRRHWQSAMKSPIGNVGSERDIPFGLYLDFWATVEKLNLSHNFWTKKDRVFIFHMYFLLQDLSDCNKNFDLVILIQAITCVWKIKKKYIVISQQVTDVVLVRGGGVISQSCFAADRSSCNCTWDIKLSSVIIAKFLSQYFYLSFLFTLGKILHTEVIYLHTSQQESSKILSTIHRFRWTPLSLYSIQLKYTIEGGSKILVPRDQIYFPRLRLRKLVWSRRTKILLTSEWYTLTVLSYQNKH